MKHLENIVKHVWNIVKLWNTWGSNHSCQWRHSLTVAILALTTAIGAVFVKLWGSVTELLILEIWILFLDLLKRCQTLDKLCAIKRGEQLRANWACLLNDQLSATLNDLLSTSTEQSVYHHSSYPLKNELPQDALLLPATSLLNKFIRAGDLYLIVN